MRRIRENSIQLGHFQLLPDSCRVRCGDKIIPLEKKAMDVLLLLASRPGEIILRSEVLDAIWPNSAAGDHALNRCISNLRKALNDCVDAPSIIETVPHKGYRIIAECRPVSAGFHYKNADKIPLRLKMRPLGIFPLSAISLLIFVAAIVVYYQNPAALNADKEPVRIISSPAKVIYVAPTVTPAERQRLSELAEDIKTALIEGLIALDFVVIASEQPSSRVQVPDSEREKLAAQAEVAYLASAEIFQVYSDLSVRVFVLHAQSGELLWYRTFDFGPDGPGADFQRQLQVSLATEAMLVLR